MATIEPGEKPPEFQTIAMLQIISAVIQIPTWFIIFLCGSNGLACICGVITSPIGGCGAFCGFIAFLSVLLLPIALVELISGILTLTSPKPPLMLIRITAGLEMVGLLFGGLVGAVVGVMVWIRLQDPHIIAYYEED